LCTTLNQDGLWRSPPSERELGKSKINTHYGVGNRSISQCTDRYACPTSQV
jgi:hypothetical protein